jgi:hypothetical protein
MKSPPIAWRRGMAEALKTEFSFGHELRKIFLRETLKAF